MTAQVEVQLVREAKVESLLGLPGDYEASGVVLKDDQLYVVFDDDGRIARFDPALTRGELLGSRDSGNQYEGITWDPVHERFFVVVESLKRTPRPGLVELDAELRVVAQHEIPFELSHPNKGGEGLTCVVRDGEPFLLVLLEGNHGKGGRVGKEPGHGLVLVLKQTEAGLEQVAELRLPPEAAFEDYAGIDHREGRLAVVSQASAKLWVGTLDPATWTVDAGLVYDFPREDGQETYGKVEGVAWLDARTLACVSDEAKPDRPEQRAKAESVHVFQLPE